MMGRLRDIELCSEHCEVSCTHDTFSIFSFFSFGDLRNFLKELSVDDRSLDFQIATYICLRIPVDWSPQIGIAVVPPTPQIQ